jgi:CheY-like chemotaxis protein
MYGCETPWEATDRMMNTSATNPARILVMEDNAADIYLLRHALDQHEGDYQLEVLPDGEAAIRFIQQQRTSIRPEPCVIVLDVHLPKHDGVAVLAAIRREPSLSSVHVVAWTTLAAPRDEDKLRSLGVRLCTIKPAELDGWIDLAGQILAICREKDQLALA